MTVCKSWLAGAIAVLSWTTPGLSADPQPVSRDWTFTLGIEGRVLPSYEGSDRYVLRPIPLINIRRAGTPRGFSSPRDGASVAILESGSFHLGPTAKIKFPRKESQDTDLRGLGDVNWAFEGGVFAEYWALNWLRTRAEIRQGFGGHHGVVADLSADLVAPVSKQLTLSAGPRMVLASGKAQDPYFSISSVQSAASGLPTYTASGGLQSYGFGAQARYEWDSRWASHFFVEYDHLTGSAANSPLVIQRGGLNQIQVGIGTTYSFNVPGLW